MQSQDLKKVGLKVTLPRMKILEFLENSQSRHVNAEDVYRALLNSGEEIGLATVYRVLNQFETAGLVIRRHFTEGGQAVFELAQDTHHDHLVCNICGEVIEFRDQTIRARLKIIAENMRFKIDDYSLVLHGDCLKEDCEHRKIRLGQR
jgi:Fur family ferric uptake transcriptional regulator